ncbi:MAG: hypothetical protein ACRYG5_13340 [Janthinobacterium lividum]
MQEVPRKYYTRALIQEAVRRVREEGKLPALVARELALAESTICRWLAECQGWVNARRIDGQSTPGVWLWPVSAPQLG